MFLNTPLVVPFRARPGSRAVLALGLVGVLLATGCSDDSSPLQPSDLEAPEGVAMAPAGTPTGLKALRPESVLSPGDRSQIRLVDDNGNSVPASEVTWSSGLSSVATVSRDGVVVGVSPGTAVVTAQRGSAVAQHHVVVVGGGSSALRLSPRSSLLFPGERNQLEVYDAEGRRVSASEVSWSTSSSSVATISSTGTVTAVSGGPAVITVRRGTGVAQHGVIVVGSSGEPSPEPEPEPDPGSDPGTIKVSPRESVLSRGDVSALQVTDGSGAGVDPSDVTWTSGLSNVATVSSSGLVRGGDPGVVVLTARVGGAISHSVATVVGGGSSSLRIASLGTHVAPGETSEIRVMNASGDPVRASDLTWSTSAASVATVSSAGVVTGVAPGFAIITARRSGGVAQHAVYVTGDGAPPAAPDPDENDESSDESSSGIRITVWESVLSPGDVNLLEVVDGSGNPVDATRLSWASSDPGVATVSSRGLVKGISGGRAMVTARLGTDSARHSVVVFGASGSDPISRIDLTPSSSSLGAGESITLQATARNASGGVVAADFTWSSDRPDVAQVSSSGRLTGVSEGSTTIRVSAGGVTASHSVVVQASDPGPTPPRGEWNEPDNFVTLVDEHWNSFDDLGWYHQGTNPGRVDIQNGKVVWTYTEGMPGGRVPGSPVVLDLWHGPYEYHRDEGVTLSANFHGHQSGVNKLRYWSDVRPKSPLGFFGADGSNLTLGINTGDWPMGVQKLRWDSPENYASPTSAQAVVARGVPHDIETLLYVGTPGNADGWIKVWLNGVLILDFRNLGIVWPGERAAITQVHLAPVWGGMGDAVPATQTLSIDRTYVSVRP